MNSNIMLLTRKIISLLILVFVGSSFNADPVFKEKKSDFILWQLPSQINTNGNSYVFRMNNGKICVMDGGVKEETDYLRGFLASLGNEVEYWFISHPHLDHMGALNEILKDPKDVRIKNIYHFEMSKEYYSKYEVNFKPLTEEFYANLKKSGINVVNVKTPGILIKIGNTSFKVLNTKNEDLLEENPYNNQCMVVKVWDDAKSMVFLGDLGVEAGDKLLKSP
ncbi:MAG TPA: MBL fold metallo-hydrolase, partial [Flavitalea sp.]|nr:MBL fold metallo-hydrolase [Flavitalea sp.]